MGRCRQGGLGDFQPAAVPLLLLYAQLASITSSRGGGADPSTARSSRSGSRSLESGSMSSASSAKLTYEMVADGTSWRAERSIPNSPECSGRSPPASGA